MTYGRFNCRAVLLSGKRRDDFLRKPLHLGALLTLNDEVADSGLLAPPLQQIPYLRRRTDQEQGHAATCAPVMPVFAPTISRTGFGSSVIAVMNTSALSSIASGSRPAAPAAARTQPIF